MYNYFVKLRFNSSNSIMVSADRFSISYMDIIFSLNGEYTCFIDKRDILLIRHYDDAENEIVDFENVPFPEVM